MLGSSIARPAPRLRWLAAALLALAACGPKNADTTAPGTPTTAAPTATTEDDDQLETRLALLSERLEAARKEHHIPGLAVAVVKDDKIIFAEGFGLADIEHKRPATPNTVFAVGSTTKAFSSAAVAMQVDAGAMTWDDPIDKYVPEFKLATRTDDPKAASPTPTIRDLLCHRTGFTRMSMLWASGELTADEVLAKASGAEPIANFREKFHYNNVTYAAAGYAAARSADTTWSQMMQTRIFEPLGMGHTTTNVAGAKADEELANRYRWREVSERHEAMPMRSIDAGAPAGAINSNVLDMAQWIRLQLGRGTIDGKTLIQKEQFEQMWAPQIDVGGPIKYGLGWMIGDWNGHRVVEHGGNIDGYTAEVGMLPDDGIGFVMLANLNNAGLQRASLDIVFDSLLGELPSEEGDAAPAEDLSPYLGKYVADFGPFDDVRFVVSKKGDTLFVDVPGQRNYELKAPDDKGRRAFALTNAIQVSFDVDDAGKAQVLHMLQGGMNFELPREGHTIPSDVDLSTVTDLLGRYESEDGKLGITVAIEGGHFVADVDKQMALKMRKPDADGRYSVRETDTMKFSFRRDKKGAVDALIVHQGGVDKPLPRTKANAEPLPTVADLLKRAKAKAADDKLAKIAKAGVVELRGTVSMPSAAVEGTFVMRFDGTRNRMELDLGRHGRIIEGYDGEKAVSVSTMSQRTEAEGKYLRQATVSTPLLVGDWTSGFERATVEGRTEIDGKSLVDVSLRAPELPAHHYFVDPKTGRVMGSKIPTLHEGMGAIESEGKYSEYRKVLGLVVPHRMELYSVHSGKTILKVESVKKVKGDAAELFAVEL